MLFLLLIRSNAVYFDVKNQDSWTYCWVDELLKSAFVVFVDNCNLDVDLDGEGKEDLQVAICSGV